MQQFQKKNTSTQNITAFSRGPTIARKSPGYGRSFLQASKNSELPTPSEETEISPFVAASQHTIIHSSTLQRKPPKAPVPITKTPEEIEAKQSELDADITVVKPGQKLNRWDKDITKQVMEEEGIKREVELYSPTLCGKTIKNVNKLCKDKIDKVNTAFGALPEADKKQITDSLQEVGGYAYRVQTNTRSMDKELASYGLTGYGKAKFSDHSVGCAIDINASMGTKQNYHFKKAADLKLIFFVEQIIKKYDPDFDLDTSTGVDQLNGINSFSGHLQTYVNELVGNVEKVDIFDAAQEKIIKGKLKKSKTDTKNCKLILANWNTFKGWEKGTSTKTIKGKSKKKDKTVTSIMDGSTSIDRSNSDTFELQGIIDLNQTFLSLMISAGWTWGGDGSGYGRTNKDYMHFEDRDAMALMKTAAIE
jgi:hypothetical protein